MEFCRSSASRRSHTEQTGGCLPSVRGDRGRREFRCPWSEDSTMYTSLDIEKPGRVVIENIVKLLLVQLQPLTGETQAT